MRKKGCVLNNYILEKLVVINQVVQVTEITKEI